jgi:hypothetical protein
MNRQRRNVLYFGCWQESGHYLHDPTGSLPRREARELIPWDLAELDTGLAPKRVREREGIAKLHVKKGWAALAFWDRSVDQRFQSNAVFLVKGATTAEEVIAAAEKHFAFVTKRLRGWPPKVVP